MLQGHFKSTLVCIAADEYVMEKNMKNVCRPKVCKTLDAEGSSVSSYVICLNWQILSSLKYNTCWMHYLQLYRVSVVDYSVLYVTSSEEDSAGTRSRHSCMEVSQGTAGNRKQWCL